MGYVIGPRIAGIMFAGGVLVAGAAALLTILGEYITVPFPPIHPNFANNPATGMPFLISEMAAGQMWSAYPLHRRGRRTGGRPHHAGPDAPDDPGLGAKASRVSAQGLAGAVVRTERDLPMMFVLVGSLLLAPFLALAPKMPMQGNF